MNLKHITLYALLVILLSFTVSAFLGNNNAEFQDLENPEYKDLLEVSNPHIEDFRRLDKSNQQRYLLQAYNAEFAEEYISDLTFTAVQDRAIAQRYFSDDVSHANKNKETFTAYLQAEGISFLGMEGNINSYHSNGEMQGRGQTVNINEFKAAGIKSQYALKVDAAGNIIIVPKDQKGNVGKEISFEGNIQARPETGRLSIRGEGKIDGVAVKDAYHITINENGEITHGVFSEYAGLVFEEPSAVRTTITDSGTVTTLNDAHIAFTRRGTELYLEGDASFSDYDSVYGNLYVAKDRSFVADGVMVKAKEKSVRLRIVEGGIDRALVWLGEATESKEVSSVRLMKSDTGRMVKAQGEDVIIEFRGKSFVGVEDEKLTIIDIDFDNARNGRYFQRDDRGEEVTQIQKMLMGKIDPDTGKPYLSPTYMGRSGKVMPSDDGIYGGLTVAAVREWQKDHTLPNGQALVDDGYFGENTLLASRVVGNDVSLDPKGSKVVASTDGTRLSFDSGRSASELTIAGATYSIEKGEVLRDIEGVPGKIGIPLDIAVRDEEDAEIEYGIEEDEEGDAIYGITIEDDEDFGKETKGSKKPGIVRRRAVGGLMVAGVAVTDTILSVSGTKERSPYSTNFFQHYVGGSGREYILEEDEIPQEWKSWIVTNYGKNSGTYGEVSPYNSGIFDLRNSFGHFDLQVASNPDGSTTYTMTDHYVFGAQEYDPQQTSRHGFPLGGIDDRSIARWNGWMPPGEYENPAGFTETFEVKKIGGEATLLIPQQVLDTMGEPFPVRASFTVPAEGRT